jgi:nicotinamide phosphoribosyltransferase
MFEVSNTHSDFAWLTNALESVISCEMWHAMTSANVGYEYRKIVNKYFDLTCDDTCVRGAALGDFSMRGQESKRSAYKSSAGWLLSHINTATVPAIPYLEKYYNCDCSKEVVGRGAISTEHSVMCSNYAVDGDEITQIKRLLTEIYPNNSFSMVSDSYDYWRLVNELLPQCKKEIEEHNGCLLVRGDSGNPVEVVTQTVYHLADTFGYTVNSKGYKVLNPKVKAIYGDSITLTRAKKIYKELESKGFAACNVVLGVGSFSMQCLEDDKKLNPFTRDTFGIAIKATHIVMKNGEEHFVFKNPKESTFKKSHKGCCVVLENQNGLYCHDEQHFEDTYSPLNKMEVVFKDGKMIKEYSLKEIRDRLWEGKFYE